MVKRNEVINACGMSLEYLSCILICPWLSLGLKLGDGDREGRRAEQPDFPNAFTYHTSLQFRYCRVQ